MLFNYNPDQVSVVFAGIGIDPGAGPGGYADGDFVTIEQDTDDFTDVAGTDGQVTRAKSSDGRATITIRLMQSSKTNPLLSALNQLDKNTPNGAGVGALMVRDKNGTSLHVAAEAWIAKAPAITYGREATAREWKLRCANLVNFVGSL